jgi:nitroreductase
MDMFEAIQTRRSVRAYESRAIPEETLLRILEAGRIAPSAGNIQPWHFIVVTDGEKRRILSKGVFAGFLTQAPTVIVACGDAKASPKWHVVDVSIALENMVLAATGEGLGTCWIGSFSEEEVKALLEIPENYRVVALLAVGYPRKKLEIGRKLLQTFLKRKKITEIVSSEKFGERTSFVS